MLLEYVPYHVLPGALRLVADFLGGAGQAGRFYPYLPGDGSALPRRLQQLRFPLERRRRIAAALQAQNPGCPAW
ncbi:MAG: hypothetical protein ACPL88_10230, partial [Bryobacteraceae bacterium]